MLMTDSLNIISEAFPSQVIVFKVVVDSTQHMLFSQVSDIFLMPHRSGLSFPL